MNHFLLGFKVVNHTLVCGNAAPGLNAEIRRVSLGSVPKTDIFHIVKGKRYRLLSTVALQCNCLIRVVEENCVIVEKLVLQINSLDSAAVIELVVLGTEAGGREVDTHSVAGISELNIIILKLEFIIQGNIEGRVTAKGEDKLLVVAVFNRVNNLKSIIYKLEGNIESEGEGIFLRWQARLRFRPHASHKVFPSRLCP